MPGGNAAVINGVNYGQISTASSFTLSAAPLTLPSAGAGTFSTFTFPFTLTGSIQGFPSSESHTQLFDVNLTGAGTAHLGPLRNIGGAWINPNGMTLTFHQQPSQVPTPEPATLLLMSGGLAACLRVTRRRRKP